MTVQSTQNLPFALLKVDYTVLVDQTVAADDCTDAGNRIVL